jgi:ketosteroid isomerase-like protein
MAIVVLLAGVLASPAPAVAGQERHGGGAWCERSFAETVRRRDAAFEARDLPALMTHYRQDAVEVDPSGATHLNRAEIAEHLGGLFQLRFDATFVEIERVIVDCDTALLVLDSTFDLPDLGVKQRFVTTQTFTEERGRWKLLLAANTMLPA